MDRGHFSTFQQAVHRAKKRPRTNIYIYAAIQLYVSPSSLNPSSHSPTLFPGVIFSEISNVQVLKGLRVGRSSARCLEFPCGYVRPISSPMMCKRRYKGRTHVTGDASQVAPAAAVSCLTSFTFQRREKFSRMVKTSYEILMAGCLGLESTQRLCRVHFGFFFFLRTRPLPVFRGIRESNCRHNFRGAPTFQVLAPQLASCL